MPPLNPYPSFPKHLYHATLPPRVAHNSEEVAEARKAGYGDTYIAQAYPKHVGTHELIAKDAKEEATILAREAGSRAAPAPKEKKPA